MQTRKTKPSKKSRQELAKLPLSSRSDAKKWATFCKHMREAIIDEQKAVPDYTKLIKQANDLLVYTEEENFREIVEDIISDEKRHREELLSKFNYLCPRMAVHKRRRPRRQDDIMMTDEDSAIQYEHDRYKHQFTD